MKKTIGALIAVIAVAQFSCEDDNSLKGSLKISLTDSPVDADNVKSVNLFINSVEAKQGNEWMSIKTFDQPTGVNLLEYSGGKSFPLIDQFTDPGTYSAIRFSLNMSDKTGSLIRSPQCNLVMTDGSTQPIVFSEIGKADAIVTHDIGVGAHGYADYTFDVDVRKSLTVDDLGNYIFKPAIRVIETYLAGHIKASVTNYTVTDRVVVFAYPAGQFSNSETNPPAAGGVRFSNAITSGRISQNKFGLGFLPAGNYDLVFAKHNSSGEFLSISGRFDNVAVAAKETVNLNIDLNTLSGS